MEKIKWGVLGCAGIAAEQTIPAMQQAENAEIGRASCRERV